MNLLLNFLLITIFTQSLCDTDRGIFGWLFNNYYKNEESEPTHKIFKGVFDTSMAFAVKIPFELNAGDEKFLNAMQQVVPKEMTQLAKCNHRVIIGLQSSCDSLSDEDLSKVAVNLLNCQSAIENRHIYLCTKLMKIHECTANMDQDTWNAYHIVSNRARAVCYQLRQEQFKAQTELIVNQLVTSAEEQSNALSQINEQQKRVANGQHAIHGFVTSNIRELVKEKSLIASGQKELSRTTLSIKEKLESAQKMLTTQGNYQQELHKQILLDLADIQENARKVWDQLDESTTRMVKIHNQTAIQYELLMSDLNRMNYTVHHLLQVIVTMKRNFEAKFAWIATIIGDTDVSVNKIYTVIIHLLYLFIGMISASFLQVPYVSRVLLVFLVPLNAMAEFHQNQSLPLSNLTALLAVCLLCNLMWNAVSKFSWLHQKSSSTIDYEFSNENLLAKHLPNADKKSAISHTKSIKDSFSSDEDFHYKLQNSLRKRLVYDDLKEANETDGNLSTSLFSTSNLSKNPFQEFRNNLLDDSKRFNSSIFTPDSSPHRRTRRKICSAICRSGLPCRIQSSVGFDLCHRHLAGSRDTTPVPH